jgi:large subunit ribosomal protein L25
MKEVVLEAKRRDVIGKQVKALRRAGRVPAILYGRNIQPIPVTLDARETNRVIPTITSSHLVVVDIAGERHTALVREKQYNPILGTLVHVDFNVVSMTEKLRTTVSIYIDGESPAVKDFNGVIVTGQEELEVQCLPQYLPERITIDISMLKRIGDIIRVSDISLPAEVEVLTDLDEMVVLVTAPVSEEAEAGLAGPVEPEIIEKGKKEDEE